MTSEQGLPHQSPFYLSAHYFLYRQKNVPVDPCRSDIKTQIYIKLTCEEVGVKQISFCLTNLDQKDTRSMLIHTHFPPPPLSWKIRKNPLSARRGFRVSVRSSNRFEMLYSIFKKLNHRNQLGKYWTPTYVWGYAHKQKSFHQGTSQQTSVPKRFCLYSGKPLVILAQYWMSLQRQKLYFVNLRQKETRRKSTEQLWDKEQGA